MKKFKLATCVAFHKQKDLIQKFFNEIVYLFSIFLSIKKNQSRVN